MSFCSQGPHSTVTCGRYASYWNAFLFQKRVSRILSTEGEEYLGKYPPDQVHPPPWDQVHPPPPGSNACREIRATSGRYSSYWNAFLCNILLGTYHASSKHDFSIVYFVTLSIVETHKCKNYRSSIIFYRMLPVSVI